MAIDNRDDRTDQPRSSFIDGVYRYCDRWCERCRFQTRCRLFRDRSRYENAIARGSDDEELFKLIDDDDDDETPRRPMTAGERLDWENFLAEVNRPPTPAQQSAFERRVKRRELLLKQDSLTIAGRECDQLALGLVQSLKPVIEARADPAINAAFETIAWFSLMISAKTHRALHGWLNAREEADDVWRNASNADAHGTAKLLRLIVGETRNAWEVLMQAGVGDGAPAKMVERLGRLDAVLAERFPRAMAFVRPGLDEEPAD